MSDLQFFKPLHERHEAERAYQISLEYEGHKEELEGQVNKLTTLDGAKFAEDNYQDFNEYIANHENKSIFYLMEDFLAENIEEEYWK